MSLLLSLLRVFSVSSQTNIVIYLTISNDFHYQKM